MADILKSIIQVATRWKDMGAGSDGVTTWAPVVATTPAGSGRLSSVSITRPANTTPYTAGDVIGNGAGGAAALEFTSVGASGGMIMIIGADLECDIAAVPAGMGNMRLHLYSVTPPSALADNAAFDIPSGDRASYLTQIDLGTPVDQGSTLYVPAITPMAVPVQLAGTSLFAYLMTAGGFTPAANSEVYKVRIRTLAL